MPNTRKKVIKVVYKDEDDSEAERAAGDFSDSGSEAEIPDQSTSEDDVVESANSSVDEFDEKSKKKLPKAKPVRKKKFAKEFISKINRQSNVGIEEDVLVAPAFFSVKDLTAEDKLLPSVLNLSESDSSEDESPKAPARKQVLASSSSTQSQSDNEAETPTEYKDVWSKNIQDDSEEVAKRTFMELEQHKTKIEETKASILNYQASKMEQDKESDVKDLLAQGEAELPPLAPVMKTKKSRRAKADSDSEMEDWEEVQEATSIPAQGIQLVVDFPDAVCRKTKKIDVEMMMKRKINRVKKEYQVYMHKVHVLCWLGHGNYVSRVLNDQEVLAAALTFVPSKECYPGERVDMKYLEQITTWFRDKLTLKQDKHEEKFRPKAPPLKTILLNQMKNRVVTTKKYLVFIFVSILRALGLQCRVMFNFVTVPIKPPSSELCSLSTKCKDDKSNADKNNDEEIGKEKPKNYDKAKKRSSNSKLKQKIPQTDGNYDSSFSSGSDMDHIMQVDGNDDELTDKIRSTRSGASKKTNLPEAGQDEDVSPPKRARKILNTSEVSDKKVIPQRRRRAIIRTSQDASEGNPTKSKDKESKVKSLSSSEASSSRKKNPARKMDVDAQETPRSLSIRKDKTMVKSAQSTSTRSSVPESSKTKPPVIKITNEENETSVLSLFYVNKNTNISRSHSLRRKTPTTNPSTSHKVETKLDTESKPKARNKSAPGRTNETSKYFESTKGKPSRIKRGKSINLTEKEAAEEDKQRVSHKDLAKTKVKPKNDVTCDLVDIIKKRVNEAKENTKKGIVKGKQIKQESDYDSDHLLEEPKRRKSDSDEDFKPTKISPKASTSKKIDRRVLSSDIEETPKNKCDVWCEVFVEELEQWISVDVIRAKIHCPNEIYNRASHPVCYIVGWDNNNYLKDLTRRYVPHWNTVTRKQRAEPTWWDNAIKPWLGPKNARDREEDEQLNRMQLEAPLPTSIGEYKNHPLYALKRHLLKFEAIYPPDAATLGFVRSEAVYARECVYVCRSRDTWLKEAKVVKLGEQPYKIVKARPKWDKLSNKLITDKPLEVFGPWQVQDYEPPVAENGVVPRNAYGNVELFKDCMLPKGTVHIKLPGLNRVAKKLNIDCAPAMTGFDFNGGWSHPVYDGFVVCQEFEEIVTDAWVKDQEDQVRKEREKVETRVYGNWKRLIKGLLIKQRLKNKYGFSDVATASTSKDKKNKGPRLAVKKNN